MLLSVEVSMAFKIEIDRKLKRLLKSNANRGLVQDVRKQFDRQKSPAKIKRAIVQDVIKGISPVKKGGKWKKYSKGYKKEINKNKSKRMQAASPTKRLSPVNLRLTGKLHKSLTVFTKRKALIFQFKHFLADIHNRLGAGKSKVIRRLLPTNKGEQFNRKINTTIFDELKKAVDNVAKQFSRR